MKRTGKKPLFAALLGVLLLALGICVWAMARKQIVELQLPAVIVRSDGTVSEGEILRVHGTLQRRFFSETAYAFEGEIRVDSLAFTAASDGWPQTVSLFRHFGQTDETLHGDGMYVRNAVFGLEKNAFHVCTSAAPFCQNVLTVPLSEDGADTLWVIAPAKTAAEVPQVCGDLHWEVSQQLREIAGG